MVGTEEATTLAILTFWVGPFLLGVAADQIVRLPSPPRQNSPNHDIGSDDGIPRLDLRTRLAVCLHRQQKIGGKFW